LRDNLGKKERFNNPSERDRARDKGKNVSIRLLAPKKKKKSEKGRKKRTYLGGGRKERDVFPLSEGKGVKSQNEKNISDPSNSGPVFEEKALCYNSKGSCGTE